MAQTIGTVLIDVKSDTSKLVEGMDRAEKRVNSTVKNMTKMVVGLGGAYAAFSGVKKLQAAADEAAKLADKVGKVAEKYSLSTEALSKYEYAAGFADVSQTKLYAGLGALTRRLNNFQRDGGGAAAKAFKELGIDQEFARTQMNTTEEAMGVLLQKLNEMPDGIQKTAIAQDLFSKSSADVVRMANLGKDALKAYGDEAERSGVMISSHFAAVSATYNDAQARLDQMQQGYANVATAESGWLEFSTAVYNDMGNLVMGFTEDMQNNTNSWSDNLKSFLESSYAVFPSVWKVMTSVWDAGVQLASGLWEIGNTVVTALIPSFQGYNQESNTSITVTGHLLGLVQGGSMAFQNFGTVTQMASVGLQMFGNTIKGYVISRLQYLISLAYKAGAALADFASISDKIAGTDFGATAKDYAIQATKFEAKAIQSAVSTTSKIEDLGNSFSKFWNKLHTFDDIDAKMKSIAVSASEAQNNSKGIFDFKMPPKHEIEQTQKAYDGLTKAQLTFQKANEKANKASSKANKSTQKLYKSAVSDQFRWNEKFKNDYSSATLSAHDNAVRLLDIEKTNYLSHNQDKLQVSEWYNSELNSISERYAEKEKKNQDSVWKNFGKNAEKNSKAKADFLSGGIGNSGGGCVGGNCGQKGAYITPQQSQKYASQAGKSFSGSFKEGMAGKKAEKSYESMGSKFGGAFGNAIKGALTDYIDGEGDITLREASREQFDSQIGGAIRSEYPMVALAADIYSALNTETRNEFQQMATNINESNEGIANSLTMLENVMYPELEYTRKMAGYLESMDNKFGGIAVTLSSVSGFDYTGSDYDVNTNTMSDIFQDGKLISYEAGGVKGGIGGFIDGFMDSLFGTTTKTLEASGIAFGTQTAQSFMDGAVDGVAYQDIKISKRALFGFVKTTGFKTIKEDLDSSIEQNLAEAMTIGYGAISESMQSLGAYENSLGGLEFEAMKLDFKDKSTEEIQQIVTGAFTGRLDTLAEHMFSDIESYQVAGEDYAQTIIRIGAQYNQAEYALDRLGISTVAYTDVVNKSTSEFGGEVAKTSILLKENGSGIGQYIDTLSASTEVVVTAYTELHSFQIALLSTSDIFKEFDKNMIAGAGGREALMSGQASLLTDFYTLQEQNAIKQAQMNEELLTFGMTLPATKDDWRELLESISDPKLYGRLLSMSDEVADAFKSIEDSAKDAVEAMMKQVEVQTDLLLAEQKVLQLREDMQKEYNDILKDSAKTLRDLARSSDSAKDGIYNVGLADNESINYYLNRLNEKESLFTTYFDNNGAILAGKYEDMQQTYGEINSIVSTLAGSIENFDPSRQEYLKENLYSLLGANQSLANSNAKVMEVQISGGTLDGVLGGLTINEFSTLVGLSESQKAELTTVANQTVGLATETTLGSRYTGQNITIDNTAFTQAGYIPTETGLMRDNTFGLVNVSSLMQNSTYKDPLASVSIGNITSAQTDVSSLMRDNTFSLVDISALATETTLGSRYTGQNITIDNTAFTGSTKLSDLLGSTGSGLTGILTLTDEQKQKIEALEAKVSEEVSAQTYYSKASTYFDTVLADLARKAEADSVNLSATSFGATSVLGAQEDVDFQTILGNAGQVLNATERDTLYSELKGFATQADDSTYLKTLIGYDSATGAVANTAKLEQLKAFQSYLPSDATSAYSSLKNQAAEKQIELGGEVWRARDSKEAIEKISSYYGFYTPADNTTRYVGSSFQEAARIAVGTFNANSHLPYNLPYHDWVGHSGYKLIEGVTQARLDEHTNYYNALQQRYDNLPQFFNGGSTGLGSPHTSFQAELHHQEYVVPHQGALVLKQNNNESKELKEIKEVLKKIEKENKILRETVQQVLKIQRKEQFNGKAVYIIEEKTVA